MNINFLSALEHPKKILSLIRDGSNISGKYGKRQAPRDRPGYLASNMDRFLHVKSKISGRNKKMPQKVMSFSRNREGKQLYQNGCVAPAQTEAPREALKDMEITEAIQDLDSKLSDIEAALHLDGHNLRKI